MDVYNQFANFSVNNQFLLNFYTSIYFKKKQNISVMLLI